MHLYYKSLLLQNGYRNNLYLFPKSFCKQIHISLKFSKILNIKVGFEYRKLRCFKRLEQSVASSISVGSIDNVDQKYFHDANVVGVFRETKHKHVHLILISDCITVNLYS